MTYENFIEKLKKTGIDTTCFTEEFYNTFIEYIRLGDKIGVKDVDRNKFNVIFEKFHTFKKRISQSDYAAFVYIVKYNLLHHFKAEFYDKNNNSVGFKCYQALDLDNANDIAALFFNKICEINDEICAVKVVPIETFW